jgi:hypothetical protein
MPLVSPVLATAFVGPNLLATGQIGQGMPKFALGVSLGVVDYLSSARVITTDVGTLGVGTSIIPMIVPQPLLLGGILSGMGSMGILGPMAPLVALGLANGITIGLAALALLQTNHPSVGTGAGVARIVGGTAVPAMIGGFDSVNMSLDGSKKMATAIGIGLDITFAAFFQPIPIVGPSAPVNGAGVGFGSVI